MGAGRGRERKSAHKPVARHTHSRGQDRARTKGGEDVLEVLLADEPVTVVVDERERLAELLDLGRGEEREHARGLAPRARLLRLGELRGRARGRDVRREAVRIARHGVVLQGAGSRRGSGGSWGWGAAGSEEGGSGGDETDARVRRVLRVAAGQCALHGFGRCCSCAFEIRTSTHADPA